MNQEEERVRQLIEMLKKQLDPNMPEVVASLDEQISQDLEIRRLSEWMAGHCGVQHSHNAARLMLLSATWVLMADHIQSTAGIITMLSDLGKIRR